MEKISVAFKNKKKANSLLDMLVFDKNIDTRGWYIKDDVPEDKRNELRALSTYIEEEITNDATKITESPNREIIVPNTSMNEHVETIVSLTDWNKLLEEGNTLKIALAIQQIGLPNDEDIRTKILRKLSVRQEGVYPINYDGLINSCPDFANRYSMEYLENLLKSCITGERFYVEEIVTSNHTEEEKALMLFALPLE